MNFTEIFESKITPKPKIIEMVLYNFNLISQMHIFHLLTKNSAEHNALDEFYNGLIELNDNLAEFALALDVDLSRWSNEVYENKLIFVYTKEIVLSELASYRAKITASIIESNKPELASINDTFINLQKLIDNLSYKLRQS